MVEHEIERHGERGVVAVDDHGGGVADEADVDPGGVDVDGGGVVVGGDDGDGLPAAVLAAERGHRDAARRLLRARPPVDGGLRHVAEQAPRQLPEEGRPAHGVTRGGGGGACARVIGWLVGGKWERERWGREWKIDSMDFLFRDSGRNGWEGRSREERDTGTARCATAYSVFIFYFCNIVLLLFYSDESKNQFKTLKKNVNKFFRQ